MDTIKILLIEPDEKTAIYIRQLLRERGYEVDIARDGKEGLASAWRDRPAVIVLELNLPDLDGLEVVHQLRRDPRTRNTPLVSLTYRNQPEDTVAGLEAGLTEYILKQSDAVNLLIRTLSHLAIVKQASATEATPSLALKSTGRLITFLSAKGGVGTSSVCLNVASQMSRLDPENRMVVIDLVLPLGSLAQITAAESKVDLVRLTEMAPEQLTPDFLRASLPYMKSWGFHIVPGTEHPRRASHLDAERLPAVLQAIRLAFDYVVVDIGRNLSRLSLPVLMDSDVLVMVLSPTPLVVDNTRAVLEMFEEEGILSTRFFILTNRPVGAEDMSSAVLEEALGRPANAGVPTMGEAFNLANNLHVPLHLRFPDDATTLIIHGVAASLLERLRETARSYS